MNRVILFSLEYIERGLRGNFVHNVKYKIGICSRILYVLQIPVYGMLWILSVTPLVKQLYETISRVWSRGVVGFFLRGAYWKANLGGCGVNVFIDQYASAFGMNNIYIGNNTHIDTGVILLCAKGRLQIGNYCHVANNALINGKPFVTIGDHTALAASCKVYGSTAKAGGSSMSPMSFEDMVSVEEVGIHIGSNALVGINSVVLPGARIGDYACLGANSFCQGEIPNCMIALGNPAKIIKERVLRKCG